MENKPFIIGVTGGSGSGKTTFIKKLEETFSDDAVCIVSQDDYYRPKNEIEVDAHGITNFDRPEAIYKNELQRDLLKLKQGEAVQRQEYTFNNINVVPQMLTFQPRPVIILEGLFIFHFKEIYDLLDLKIFVDAKDNFKIIRRIRRDKIERNYPLEDVLYRYEHHVTPAFEKYVLPYKQEADIVINNNTNLDKGLQVTQGFIRDFIRNKTIKKA